MEFQYLVKHADNGRTIKSILKNEFHFSKNLIRRFKYHGRVLCNQSPVYMNHLVSAGDIVKVSMEFEETSENVRPVQMALSILFEDEALIALDKPSNIIIHPTGANIENTMANGLMSHFEERGERIKVRPVSRLDKDTTGVIVFAKNQYVQEKLILQMKNQQYIKEYIGIVHGRPAESSGTIDLPIARTPGSIILREVSETGAPSVTHYSVTEYFSNAAKVRFLLETGRTHHIRVQCKAIGHPLIGDTLYSDDATPLISRQALHAQYVRFNHPLSGERIELRAPLPQDMATLLDILSHGAAQ